MNVRSKDQLKRVIIYADGSCSGNPGPGGWCAILVYGEVHKKISGAFEINSTNNRTELKACIEGLNALKEKCRVTVRTDSRYVVDGMNLYIHGWVATKWKNNSLKNIDLWQQLLGAKERHVVTWEWVAGHNGDPLNEECNSQAKLLSGTKS